jgi:hypothetical protein
MKKFRVKVEFESPIRTNFGTPVFGTEVFEVVLASESYVSQHCATKYGKNLFHIVEVKEIGQKN